MLVSSFVFVFSCLAVVRAEKVQKGLHVPKYIVPCKVSSPEFKKCVISHGRDAIPHLLNGDPKYHLAPLVPFKVDKAEFKPSERLSLTLRNAELYGLDTVEFRDAEVDLKNKHIKGVFFAKQLKILANYQIEGQLLVLPISGEGPANFQFGDCDIEFSFDYDLVTKKDGKIYISNIRPKVIFKAAKAYFNFENLFNGNKELGENTNKVLNENPQEVLNDFGSAISDIVGSVVANIIESYLIRIPYDEVFLQ